MTDQTTETFTDDDASAFTGDPAPDHAAVKQQVDNILDLDTMLSAARLVERLEKVCVRGDLVRRYDEVIEELGTLVDVEGNLLSEDGDAALADGHRVEELQEEANTLRAEMNGAMLVVLFRALPSDEWEEFDNAQRTGSDRHLKNSRTYEHELIARTAVKPSMTPADVETKLRKKLSRGQFVKLFNAAFFVNNSDGLDVPKLPSYLHAPRQQERGLS